MAAPNPPPPTLQAIINNLVTHHDNNAYINSIIAQRQQQQQQEQQGATPSTPLSANDALIHQAHLDIMLLEYAAAKLTTGDTLIVVNFPSNQPHAPVAVRCNGKKWPEACRFVMSSEKLLGTGSSRFAAMLSTRSQARTRRSLNMTNSMPSGIEFVIDLTPSPDDEGMAAEVAALSVPKGAAEWWQAHEEFGVSPVLVSGHDDNCRHHKDLVEHGDKMTGPETELVASTPGRAIEDYCPVRHRANIVRLLLAIEEPQYGLFLNSAVRTYTLAQLANIFDCPGVARDPVIAWLTASPNDAFMEVNTEVAMSISWALELGEMVQSLFRVLVVERAAELLGAGEESTPKPRRFTILGRARDDLPEELENSVQFASIKVAERVDRAMGQLLSDDIFDMLSPIEMREVGFSETAIRELESQDETEQDELAVQELRDTFDQLVASLVDFIHAQVETALAAESRTILDRLSRKQRLLAAHPWEVLLQLLEYDHMMEFASKKGNDTWPTIRALSEKYNDVVQRHDLFSDVPLFSTLDFHTDFHGGVEARRNGWARPTIAASQRPVADLLPRSSCLALGLSEDELAVLPLWAFGLDDGSGGAFQERVPDAQLGALGPGPGFHTGHTMPSAQVASIGRSLPIPLAATPSSDGGSVTEPTVGRSRLAAPSQGAETANPVGSALSAAGIGARARTVDGRADAVGDQAVTDAALGGHAALDDMAEDNIGRLAGLDLEEEEEEGAPAPEAAEDK